LGNTNLLFVIFNFQITKLLITIKISWQYTPKLFVVGGGSLGLAAVIRLRSRAVHVESFFHRPSQTSHSVAPRRIKRCQVPQGVRRPHLAAYLTTQSMAAIFWPISRRSESPCVRPRLPIIDLLDRMASPSIRTPEGHCLDFSTLRGNALPSHGNSRARTTGSNFSTRLDEQVRPVYGVRRPRSRKFGSLGIPKLCSWTPIASVGHLCQWTCVP